ncbi:hypothetical protein OAT67_09620 [Bacteriovoracaceae bacterium]|nr:hypothetical protein [Bacteriovoracaceae bacterium]
MILNNYEKCTIISPKFHPSKDGLSDFSTIFCQKLANFYPIKIVSNQDSMLPPSLVNTSADIYKLKNFRLLSLVKLLSSVVFSPKDFGDKLIFQYVPHMYSKKAGINLYFPLFLILLKLLRPNLKLYSFVHELWHPNCADIKSKFIHYFHKLMLFPLLCCSEKTFVSCESFYKLISEFCPIKKDRFILCPVPSNISNDPSKENKITIGRNRIIHFGSDHISKEVPKLLLILDELTTQYNIEVDFIGLEKPSYFKSQNERIKFHGHLSDIKVSRFFQESYLLLAFFTDGVSTRRGSVMAALEHGCNVLTTVHESSDSLLRNGSLLLSVNSLTAYKKLLTEVILKNVGLHDSSEIESFYRDNFSWDRLISVVKEEISS